MTKKQVYDLIQKGGSKTKLYSMRKNLTILLPFGFLMTEKTGRTSSLSSTSVVARDGRCPQTSIEPMVLAALGQIDLSKMVNVER